MRNINKKISGQRSESAAVEAARAVSLCADQINAAMEEASAEIDALAQSFLAMARHAGSLADTATALQGGPVSERDAATLSGDSEAMQAAVREGITVLQVGDRLGQRLDNVRSNLTSLADLLGDSDLSTSLSQWADFLRTARAKFTMAAERRMFDTEFDEYADADSPVVSNENEPSSPVLFATDGTDV